MHADDRAVVLDRRRLAAAILVDVAQELSGGVGERRVGADHPRERASANLVQRPIQPSLGGSLGEETSRRAPAVGPGGTELFLHLAAIRETVFRVPGVGPNPSHAI